MDNKQMVFWPWYVAYFVGIDWSPSQLGILPTGTQRSRLLGTGTKKNRDPSHRLSRFWNSPISVRSISHRWHPSLQGHASIHGQAEPNAHVLSSHNRSHSRYTIPSFILHLCCCIAVLFVGLILDKSVRFIFSGRLFFKYTDQLLATEKKCSFDPGTETPERVTASFPPIRKPAHQAICSDRKSTKALETPMETTGHLLLKGSKTGVGLHLGIQTQTQCEGTCGPGILYGFDQSRVGTPIPAVCISHIFLLFFAVAVHTQSKEQRALTARTLKSTVDTQIFSTALPKE